jgi:hypothetical protein
MPGSLPRFDMVSQGVALTGIPTYRGLQSLESSSELGHLRGRNQNEIELLHNHTGKLKVLWVLNSLIRNKGQRGILNTDIITSSFSMISANVRYILSVLRLIQSWRMIRLPRVSSSLLSVLKSSSRLTMNALK